jgi:hypothetical protein
MLKRQTPAIRQSAFSLQAGQGEMERHPLAPAGYRAKKKDRRTEGIIRYQRRRRAGQYGSLVFFIRGSLVLGGRGQRHRFESLVRFAHTWNSRITWIAKLPREGREVACYC